MKMESMIDRLAIAFMDGFTDGNGQWDDNFPEYHREKYRQGVTSLLMELRNPTNGMIEAGRFKYREIPLGNGSTAQGLGLGDNPITSYTRMIDAALKENEHVRICE
jgi:hypothetical protein